MSPGGETTVLETSPDGTEEVTYPDGTLVSRLLGPDPLWGMLAPVRTSSTVTTPSGLASTVTRTRAMEPEDAASLAEVESVTDTVTVNGRTSTAMWNATSRTFATMSAALRASLAEVDGQGRLVWAQDGGFAALALSYDPSGRLETAVEGEAPDARTTVLEYDPSGYLATVTDPMDRLWSFGRDPRGRVTALGRPDGETVGLGYDGNGNVTSVTPPGRPSHLFTYSPVDQMESYAPPAVGSPVTTSYAWNPDRQLETVTRADGSVIAFTYEPTSDRLASILWPDGTGSTTLAYDGAGRLETLTAPDAESLTFAYDGFLPTTTTWTGSVEGRLETTYDEDLRVTTLAVADTATGPAVAAWTYEHEDGDGLLTAAGDLSVTRDFITGLPTATTLGDVATTTTFTPFGELSETTATYAGAPLYRETHLERDALGRTTRVEEEIEGVVVEHEYTYDLAGRLDLVYEDGVLIADHDYDANGNRTRLLNPSTAEELLGTYDDQDRLSTYGTSTYTWDDNGTLLSRTTPEGTTSYEYDPFGALRSVTVPDGTEVNYTVDPTGRRTSRSVDRVRTTAWLYQDRLNPVAELDGSGTLRTVFIYRPRRHVPDYMVRDGDTYRLITDVRGSVRLVVNAATGEVVQRLTYDPWGRVIEDTNPGFQPFGFAGGLYDPLTGLVRFGARDYDAETGRWTAKDAARFADDLGNLYSYVSNDPVNWIDLLGWMRLPASPSGLGPEWSFDPTHQDPNGERWIHESGDRLDFHRGRPGLHGWRGRDHWHHNGEEEHLAPGEEIPDPPQTCQQPNPVDMLLDPPDESDEDVEPEDSHFEILEPSTIPIFPLPFPVPMPLPVPMPMPTPMPIPIFI